MGEANEVAELVAFLVSTAAGVCERTGQAAGLAPIITRGSSGIGLPQSAV
jgi:hypothetical protein